MLKVVHISDFHLNNANLEDWNAFIKPAFINLMKQEFPENNAIIICFIIGIILKGGFLFF